MTGLILACLAASLLVAMVVTWQVMIKRVSLRQGRWIVNALAVAALVLGAAAFAQSPGTLGGILAGTTIAIVVLYFGLYALKGQSVQTPAVAVGELALDFTALDHEGNGFSLSSLRGHPVLFKIFRGHW